MWAPGFSSRAQQCVFQVLVCASLSVFGLTSSSLERKLALESRLAAIETENTSLREAIAVCYLGREWRYRCRSRGRLMMTMSLTFEDSRLRVLRARCSYMLFRWYRLAILAHTPS